MHDALPAILIYARVIARKASGAHVPLFVPCAVLPHPPATWGIHIQPVNNCRCAPELACALPTARLSAVAHKYMYMYILSYSVLYYSQH